jgi:hypothetical protein
MPTPAAIDPMLAGAEELGDFDEPPFAEQDPARR